MLAPSCPEYTDPTVPLLYQLQCLALAYQCPIGLARAYQPMVGGDDKIKILELDFLHLQEGVSHKMMRFGENQTSLA